MLNEDYIRHCAAIQSGKNAWRNSNEIECVWREKIDSSVYYNRTNLQHEIILQSNASSTFLFSSSRFCLEIIQIGIYGKCLIDHIIFQNRTTNDYHVEIQSLCMSTQEKPSHFSYVSASLRRCRGHGDEKINATNGKTWHLIWDIVYSCYDVMRASWPAVTYECWIYRWSYMCQRPLRVMSADTQLSTQCHCLHEVNL